MSTPSQYAANITGPVPQWDANSQVFGAEPDPTLAFQQRLESAKQQINMLNQAFPEPAPPTPQEPGKVPWQALVLGGLQDALTMAAIKRAEPQIKYTTVTRGHRKVQVPYRTQAYGPTGEFGGTAAALSIPVVNAAANYKRAYHEWAQGKSRDEQIKGATMTRIMADAIEGPKQDPEMARLEQGFKDGTINRVEFYKAKRAMLLKNSGQDTEDVNKTLKEVNDKVAAGQAIENMTPEQKAGYQTYQKFTEKPAKPEAAKPDFTPKQQFDIQVAEIDKQANALDDKARELKRQKHDIQASLDIASTAADRADAAKNVAAIDKQLDKLEFDQRGLRYRRNVLIDQATGNLEQPAGGMDEPIPTSGADVPSLSASPSKETFPPDLKLSNGHTLQDYANVWDKLTPEQQAAVWADARASKAKL